MKVGAIVQARMSSRRCPGKVLRDLAGRTVLAHVVASLTASRCMDGICIATSTDSADDAIAEFCRSADLQFYRGPLENVAVRCAEALSKTDWDSFVRISADSPLIDHRVVAEAVALMRQKPPPEGELDLVTNVFPRSFPKGQSVEVIRAETFQRIVPLLTTPDQQEHVTPYFYEQSNSFRILNFKAPSDCSLQQLTIDSEEDFDIILDVISSLSRPMQDYPWPVLMSLAHDYRQQAMGVPL